MNRPCPLTTSYINERKVRELTKVYGLNKGRWKQKEKDIKWNKNWLETGCWLCMLPPSIVCTESDLSDLLIDWFLVSWTAPSPATDLVAATTSGEAWKRDKWDYVLPDHFIICHFYDLFIYAFNDQSCTLNMPFLIHETDKKNIHILRFLIGKSVNYILKCCQVKVHNSSLRTATKFKKRILRWSSLYFLVLILFRMTPFYFCETCEHYKRSLI